MKDDCWEWGKKTVSFRFLCYLTVLALCSIVFAFFPAEIMAEEYLGRMPRSDLPAAEKVIVRRTTDGIPHVLAASWTGLGAGIGYVQAEDALCTLADGFTTFVGQRSLFHGVSARPEWNSTFGRAQNIDLDVFFRAFADDATISLFRDQQSPELKKLVSGYVRGYNRYLMTARRAAQSEPRQTCLWQAWVRPINDDDI